MCYMFLFIKTIMIHVYYKSLKNICIFEIHIFSVSEISPIYEHLLKQ